MTEIKISVSEKLDEILQRLADDLGIKKAEFVKNLSVNHVMDIKEKKKEGKQK